jgi:monothiol glutaredoxin
VTAVPTRPLLAPENTTEAVREVQAKFGRQVVDEVRRAVERDPLVVVGMAQNPWVKRARRALQDAGLSFTYLEYGSYLGAWRKRLAIKMWSGWPTFPQVFVKGVLLGGFDETSKALADGSLRKRLDGEG